MDWFWSLNISKFKPNISRLFQFFKNKIVLVNQNCYCKSVNLFREGMEHNIKDEDGMTIQEFIDKLQTEFPDAKFDIVTSEEGK